MDPDVVITAAMIDDFNSKKDVKDMPGVTEARERPKTRQGQLTYLIYYRVPDPSARFPHPEGFDVKPLEARLGKVMAGLLADIVSIYRRG